MVWRGTRLGKAAHQEEKESSMSESTRKATGNHLALIFPRHDTDNAMLSKDEGINEAISQGLAESHVRHSLLSSC